MPFVGNRQKKAAMPTIDYAYCIRKATEALEADRPHQSARWEALALTVERHGAVDQEAAK